MIKQYSAKLGNEDVIVETGRFAGQAGGAVTVRLGDSMVLVTATASDNVRENVDFFPLTVDYEERRYAAGKIPGGFFKREGRPSTENTLICRSIDRPIRPLFPEGYRSEVQVIVTSLSSDQEHPLDIIAFIGASAALTISDIPFGGPAGAVRIGYVDGQFIINPTLSQLAKSELDLSVAGTEQSVIMIEAGANQFPEDKMLEGIKLGHAAVRDVIAMQNRMREEIGKEKRAGHMHLMDAEVMAKVRARVQEPLTALVQNQLARGERHTEEEALRKQLLVELGPDMDDGLVKEAFEKVFQDAMRKHVLDTGIRVDGRAPATIRPLSCEVGLLPRTHGSAVFNRGETQVLNIVTLGSADDAQKIEGLSGDSKKRYMHHYNFPPFSTGEVYPLRGPRRREIGHGALAERAIEPVLPSEVAFPYAIRAVSEVLSSNGSTSMASTCASSLALMDAGVPLQSPVAGIAMGVITDGDRWCVLTDIQGVEDHLGDMDFKVTGTEKGVTAMQLDIKIQGLRYEIIEETLQRAREARLQILGVMNACLPKARPDLSPFAPRITSIKIPVDKIGALIGPGGKNIRSIIEDTGCTIDVEDDGTVLIASTDGVAAAKAMARVNALTAVPEIGRVYTGKVVRITDFGAFIEFMPGIDGLVHISQLADYRVARVEDVVQMGDEIMVMVIDIDGQGRVRLSRQAVLEGWTAEEARSRDQRPSGGSRGGDRGGPSRDGDRRGGFDRR